MDDLTGVALVAYPDGGHSWAPFYEANGVEPTHRALPEAQHEALVEVVEAARQIGLLPAPWAVLSAELMRALDNLDATLGGGRNG